MAGVFALIYSTMYNADQNSNKSFDLWMPTDWYNVLLSSFNIYAATPHHWWWIFLDIVPLIVGNR